MKFRHCIALAVIAAAALTSCDRAGVASTHTETTAAPSPVPIAGNMLTMRIDGKPWTADHDVFGAFHPPGPDRALIIAGSHGPRDADEQAFTLNLYGIEGPGRYAIRTGNPAGHVVQIANLSRERYLAGSMLGYDFIVDVHKAQANPAIIEATFSGTLVANDSSVLTIADGRFTYYE